MNWFKSLWKKMTATPADGLRVTVQPLNESPPESSPVRHADESMSNFTPRAQQVLALARLEADRLNHNTIGTEHLLLGIIVLGQGTAVNVLRRMGIDLETVRTGIKNMVGTGPYREITGNVPYTPRVKKVLALASKEARTLNHTYVGTEHILLGLLAEGDGVAGKVLKNLGVDLVKTRQEILKELDPNFRPDANAGGASASTTSSAPPKSASPLRVISPQPQRELLDLTKRYDVYCTERNGEVVVYRNARFKGIKSLFQKERFDLFYEFVELEQGGGGTIFLGRHSIIKFCEHGTTPGPESASGKTS